MSFRTEDGLIYQHLSLAIFEGFRRIDNLYSKSQVFGFHRLLCAIQSALNYVFDLICIHLSALAECAETNLKQNKHGHTLWTVHTFSH